MTIRCAQPSAVESTQPFTFYLMFKVPKNYICIIDVEILSTYLTDIPQTVQLAIFIRGIDNDFLVTEELLDIYPMQGRTTGKDIFLSMKKVFKKFNMTYNRLISITSDGGKKMIGKKMGVVSRLENEMAENNLSLIKLHFIIYQQNLTAKTMDVENVMSVVVKAINSIKPSALQSRQFEAFLAEIDSEYGGLLYYTETKYVGFFQNYQKDYPPELEEKKFIEKFAFLVDLTQHYNILNKEIQGKDQLTQHYNILNKELQGKDQLTQHYNILNKELQGKDQLKNVQHSSFSVEINFVGAEIKNWKFQSFSNFG
ncbi:general transcription factor II-I repeat domain-containing protein 2-like [Hydra vulgaris]|uniref:General transcription factor II-I repeat domain-containing protein 2-like n=1 Tax=Hydra vulgaris TaxID=6087 RepID=A0ABM4CUS4_HYDVU